MQRVPRTPSLLTIIIIIIIPFCCYTRLDTVSPSDNDHDDNNNNDTHQPLGTSRRRPSRSLDPRHSTLCPLARSLSLYLAIYLWISIDTVLYYDNLSGATHITDS